MKRPDFCFDTSVSTLQNQRYKAYTLQNYRDLPHVQRLTEEQHFALDVVGRVLPFRTNSYVVEELIDWDNIPYDPLFLLTFPQRDMLLSHHFDEMAAIVRSGAPREKVREVANKIRWELNPHPAGQMEYNIPSTRWRKAHRCAAQIPGNGPLLPESGTDVPCILYLLLSDGPSSSG